MAYKKTNWQDTLRDAQGNVIQKGTPLNAQALGKIEDGIVQAEQKIDTEIQQVTTQLAQTETQLDNLGVVSAESYTRLVPEVDDTGRLQRAIDDPNVRNIVLKRDTTYSFTTLNLKKDIRIYGEDRSTSKLKHIGTGIAIKNPSTTAIGRVLIEHLTLEMNTNTTIGIEFARVFNSQINFIDIVGGESTGIGVSFDDGATYASYYNSCYDVAINGYFDGIKKLSTGFKFANSANSNRLISCRTNYVKTGVDVATDYCNHIVIFGCAFEQFDIGVRLNGDMCQIFATRFENAGGAPSGVGVEITSTSGGNYIIGNTISNVLIPVKNDFPTGNNFILNYSHLGVKFLEHETGGGWRTPMDMRNHQIKNTGSISFGEWEIKPITENEINKIAFYKNGVKSVVLDQSILENVSTIKANYLNLALGMASTLDMRNNALLNIGQAKYQVRISAPGNPTQGMTAYADGVTWDPGSGEGLYIYKSSGWKLLA